MMMGKNKIDKDNMFLNVKRYLLNNIGKRKKQSKKFNDFYAVGIGENAGTTQ